MAPEWAFALAALVLGIEIGRLVPQRQLQPPADAVTRTTLDAELARFENRLELDLEDAREKLTTLYDRARKRLEVPQAPPRKPQDALQANGEASTTPKDRAREKVRALRLASLPPFVKEQVSRESTE